MTKKAKSKKSCKGLNAKGRLVSGYRWTKNAKCPKKAKAKKAAAKTHEKKKHGGRGKRDPFSLVRDYEAFKAGQHESRRREERSTRPDEFDFSALGRPRFARRWC